MTKMGFIVLKMEMNIEENLKIIFFMEQELLRIKTEENMSANGDLERNMDTVFIIGQMGTCTKETG